MTRLNKVLESFQRFPREPSLKRMQALLQVMGNPHRNLKAIHITGTNGKGSTSASCASILKEAGYKVGLYTSPHLFNYNERIKINGIDISDDDLLQYAKKVQKNLKAHRSIKTTLFEVLTLIMFLYFKDKNVDVAVLEVGLGGAFDSTNVLEDSVAVITNIGLEHTSILGKTKTAIAKQKAGIIKKNSVVVVGEQDKKLQALFKKEASRQKSKVTFLKPKQIKLHKETLESQTFDFARYKKLKTPLLGAHQRLNTSLAIQAVEALAKKGFKVHKKAIYEGLKNVKWPLRLELLHRHPAVLLDVGHNPHGIDAIVPAIDELFPREKRILVLGCSYDKDYKKMAKKLSTLADLIYVTQAKEHGVAPSELARFLLKKGKQIFMVKTVKGAIHKALKKLDKEGLLLALGGLYLAVEAKNHLEKSLQSD